MWDIFTWHDGTLAIAWWAVLLLLVVASIIGGSAAKR
jgi:hypothetical protein